MSAAPESPPVEIGLATPPERAWCAELMAASEPWRTLGRDRAACAAVVAEAHDTELHVARVGAVPVGFLLLRPRGLAGSPYVVAIAVAERARGRGVGTRLLDHIARHVTPAAKHLFLCVSDFNVDAQRLYARHGFVPVGRLPDYLVPGKDELILQKRLAP
ncbi:MAG: GNAT family N-acetyltransferase [Gemmatimonadetes bacterium]|nr:GNAT family N-acetyltransferase [Gemmatimonadota bacterium]